MHVMTRPGGAARATAHQGAVSAATRSLRTAGRPADRLLELQSLVGNRAVTSVVQRAPMPTPDRVRTGQRDQVNAWLTAIMTLRNLRIDAWEKTARSAESRPGLEVLAAIIPIVSLGIGGLAYAAIDGMLAAGLNKYAKEFILLSGLEAGDIAAEALFHRVMKQNRDDLSQGVRDSLASSKKSSATALAGDGDIIDCFVEANKLQSVEEYTKETEAFNSSSGTMSDVDLAGRSAALKLTYDKLMGDPSGYLRELTVGFIRLLDEVKVADLAKDYDGDRERTRLQDSELHQTSMREGNLMVFPWPRNHSLDSWAAPDLGFGGFNATGIGINTKSLERLRGAAVADLPVSMGFRFRAANPYYRIWKGDMGTTDVWFTRQPNGAIHIGSDADSDGVEWLASYYARSGREFSDSDRFTYSLLGAQKLYNAIAGKSVTQINEDP